jgi:hypothetical protein
MVDSSRPSVGPFLGTHAATTGLDAVDTIEQEKTEPTRPGSADGRLNALAQMTEERRGSAGPNVASATPQAPLERVRAHYFCERPTKSRSKCHLTGIADVARNSGGGRTRDAKRKFNLRIDQHGIDARGHGAMRRRGPC